MIKEFLNYFRWAKGKTKDNSLKWSDSPGCFERHLQRRFQNPLFREERRNVSRGDLFEAKDRDQKEYEAFNNLFNELISKTRNLGSLKLLESVRYVNEALQPLILKGIGISGKAQTQVLVLFNIEKSMLDEINRLEPNNEKLIDSIKGLSDLERNMYLIQCTRKDSPILHDEAIPSLLCEDLDTIKLFGYLSRSNPKWDFQEADILNCLKRSINDGFDSKKAEVLINAFREWPVPKAEVG